MSNLYAVKSVDAKVKFGLLEWINFLLNQEYCKYCKEYVRIGKKGTHRCKVAQLV